jgi:hypothetical protein
MDSTTKIVIQYGGRVGGAVAFYYLAGRKMSPLASVVLGAAAWLAAGYLTDKAIGA